LRGIADGKIQAAFNAPSAANPIPAIQRAAELARDRVSERTYRQEWLAEFVDDGALFVNVGELSTLDAAPYQAGRGYVIGVDWARASGGDYTVFSVIDSTAREQAQIVRMAGTPFDVQLERLRQTWRAYGQPPIIAEYNSMGAPLVERLQADGLPVTAFTTTAASKHQIMTGLELALDRRDLHLLNDPVQIAELSAYERKDRAGLPSYSAPAGMHDDTVIALALAWHGASANDWLML
jgi:hypothetical protein